jgi:hypothetical protein
MLTFQFIKAESGSGLFQRWDPGPHQNCLDPQHCKKDKFLSSSLKHRVLRQITQLNLRLSELQNEQASSQSVPVPAQPVKKEPSLKVELKSEPAEYVEEYVEC